MNRCYLLHMPPVVLGAVVSEGDSEQRIAHLPLKRIHGDDDSFVRPIGPSEHR